MKLVATLLAPLALLLVLPAARCAEVVDPPPVTALDLEGVPRLEVPAPRRTLEPSRLHRPGAPPGWVVRIERDRPANTPEDPRFDATPPPAVSGGRVFLGGGFFSRVGPAHVLQGGSRECLERHIRAVVDGFGDEIVGALGALLREPTAEEFLRAEETVQRIMAKVGAELLGGVVPSYLSVQVAL